MHFPIRLHRTFPWAQKCKTVCKIALCSESATVSLHENRQRQSCKAFIGLSIRAEMIGGRRPRKGKFSC